jgi:hypothetical protein
MPKARSADFEVFAVSEPVITAFVADPRAVHSWDPQPRLSCKYGGREALDELAKEFRAGFKMRNVIRDVALVYAPGARWGDPARVLAAPIYKYKDVIRTAVM